MKPIANYDSVKGYSEFQQLPKDGYVLEIKQAKEVTGNGNPYIEVMFDIAEGEYKDFYKQDYDKQTGEDKRWRGQFRLYEPLQDGSEKDGWTTREFKTFTNSLEDSNNGYHWDWDETKWAKKLIGGLFHYRDYQKSDGSAGTVLSFKRATTVEDIRKGTFTLPKDNFKYGGYAPGSLAPENNTGTSGDDFVVTSEDEELPWN